MAEMLPSLRVPLGSSADLDPLTLFTQPIHQVWLEIGFGSGEHLLERARAAPQTGFIGCEAYTNGVAALTAAVAEAGVTNIRIFDEDARLLLPRLPEGCLSGVYLLFPDPWPKKRHWRRRFAQGGNLDELARLIRPGGSFITATDDPGLAGWTVEQLSRHRGFAWRAERATDWRGRPADAPGTRYEAKAERQGRRAIYLDYRRTEAMGRLPVPPDGA